MSGYKFRLQKLLDIRIDEEEKCKLKFKEAQLKKHKTEEKLNNLKDDYVKASQKEYKTLIECKLKVNYLMSINNSINKTEKELNNNLKELEEKRLDLEKKQIDRKTVETLKEKKEAIFYKELDMIDQKNNDEYALYAFIRRKNEGR